MQFIDKTFYGVRSAVYRLAKPGSNVEFLLFPMVHIGSKEFYEAVKQRLSTCDLIILEGVGSSRAGSLITLSYRVVKRIKRMDLVTQEALNLSAMAGKIVNPDISGKSFDAGWKNLRARFRFLVLILLPAWILYLLFFGTREIIAEDIAVEDLPSSDKILASDEDTDDLDALILDQRDRLLIRCIDDVAQSSDQRKVIAVVYGAAHMRAAVYYLTDRLGFRIMATEWLMVFDL